ncbi:hypothetical protein [Bdellovibrio sp. HCB337]|uniref:hypothetical protein n=1 Tax=Bdellovibrio sp. HCB337 TaxID=3394358 RepID=UPI0039A75C04
MKFLSIVAVLISFVGFGSQASAVEQNYAFDLTYDEQYWFDGNHHNAKWSTPVESVVSIEQDWKWIELDSRIFVHSVCSLNSGGGFPQKMEMVPGATFSFKLNDDSFSRVRNREMFVRVESYDKTTGKMNIVAACSWYYTGGGGGSLSITGTATPK